MCICRIKDRFCSRCSICNFQLVTSLLNQIQFLSKQGTQVRSSVKTELGGICFGGLWEIFNCTMAFASWGGQSNLHSVVSIRRNSLYQGDGLWLSTLYIHSFKAVRLAVNILQIAALCVFYKSDAQTVISQLSPGASNAARPSCFPPPLAGLQPPWSMPALKAPKFPVGTVHYCINKSNMPDLNHSSCLARDGIQPS